MKMYQTKFRARGFPQPLLNSHWYQWTFYFLFLPFMTQAVSYMTHPHGCFGWRRNCGWSQMFILCDSLHTFFIYSLVSLNLGWNQHKEIFLFRIPSLSQPALPQNTSRFLLPVFVLVMSLACCSSLVTVSYCFSLIYNQYSNPINLHALSLYRYLTSLCQICTPACQYSSTSGLDRLLMFQLFHR